MQTTIQTWHQEAQFSNENSESMELIARLCRVSTNYYVIWSKTGQGVAELTDEVQLQRRSDTVITRIWA